ncbi:Hypothetical protein R9X50_00685700 [Acrodontium crateriforme]|uniref:Triacylglycerol lipase n=1 Tax=Acrodontium crateriforme TaxID=150365 RepID=A0AAQ3RAA8_9PEZI|nr:Hypothetical protein R9X50_00685700 [Acrodontium crateriforme]
MLSSSVNVLTTFVALLSSISSTVNALPTAAVDLSKRATPPSDDPFYVPPVGFEKTAPGTILRERQIISSFFGILPDFVETHQLLYRTTAVNGTPIATVTTIFKPDWPRPDQFISFQTAYDSSAINCSPSYNYQWGAWQDDLISSAEFLFLQAYLLSGWIVAAPDYEGPDAAFGPGKLEGMGTLDGMRAVSNYRSKLGLSKAKPDIVGVGYSGGSIATGWAAAMHSTYASELNIKGWVAGGIPANLTSVINLVDDTLFSGFLPIAIAGLSKPSAYGAKLKPVIDSVLTPKGKALLDFANTQCAVPNILNFFEQSIFSTDVQTLGRGILQEPTVAAVLAENVLGASPDLIPRAPMLMYHAALDEIIPYADAAKLSTQWCDRGVSIDFITYGAGGHIGTEVTSLPDAIDFVENAFDGTTKKGCSAQTKLDSIFDPIALGANLEPVATALIDFFAKIGRNDSGLKSNLALLKTPAQS